MFGGLWNSFVWSECCQTLSWVNTDAKCEECKHLFNTLDNQIWPMESGQYFWSKKSNACLLHFYIYPCRQKMCRQCIQAIALLYAIPCPFLPYTISTLYISCLVHNICNHKMNCKLPVGLYIHTILIIIRLLPVRSWTWHLCAFLSCYHVVMWLSKNVCLNQTLQFCCLVKPEERVNLINELPAVAEELECLLAEYDEKRVPEIDPPHRPTPELANPQCFGGFWSSENAEHTMHIHQKKYI